MNKNNLLSEGNIFVTVILLLGLSFSSCTKETFTSGEVRNFTLNSNLYGDTYQIQVGLPNNFSQGEKYETIYVWMEKKSSVLLPTDARNLPKNSKQKMF